MRVPSTVVWCSGCLATHQIVKVATMGIMKSKLNFLSLINFKWPRGQANSNTSTGQDHLGIEEVSVGGAKMYSWDLKPKQQRTSHRLENQVDQEIVLEGGSINGCQVVVDNCRNCRIYLLDHLAALNIDGCTDCILVSGPVKGSIFLRDSSSTTLCSVSGQLRLRDCKHIDVFGGAESEPIIEACEDISIGPYVLNYDGIGEHFKAAFLYPDKLVMTSMYDFTPPSSGEGLLHWKRRLSTSLASKYIPIPTTVTSTGFSADETKSYISQYLEHHRL